MNDVAVSVIIPTFNRKDLLGAAVRSGLAQGEVPVEIIVVDDGSTDGTSETVSKLGHRVRYLRQNKLGAALARNRGLAEARGSYVKFLDSDDLLVENSLAHQVRDLAGRDAEVSYGNWREIGLKGPSGKPPDEMPFGSPLDSLLADWWCVPSAYLYKRGTSLRGEWDASLKNSDDFNYVLQIAIAGARFCHTAHAVAVYRHHEAPRHSRQDPSVWCSDREQALNKALDMLEQTTQLTTFRRELLSDQFFRLGQVAFAFDRGRFSRLVKKAIELNPSLRVPGRLHRVLVWMFGFGLAEQILEVRRAWLRSRAR